MEPRETFDSVAALYHRVRPGYPLAALHQLRRVAQLHAGSTVLEVGCGTGKATDFLLELGCLVTGIEPGAQLAQFLRRRHQASTTLEVVNVSFEKFECDRRFELVFAAQSFHWIPPELGLTQAARFLRSDGVVALMWNLDESQETAVYQRTTPLHEEYLGSSAGTPAVGLRAWTDRYQLLLESTADFTDVARFEVPWTQEYRSDEWLELRRTFSPDLLLSPERRLEFHGKLKELIDQLGGVVRREYRCVCLSARRREPRHAAGTGR